MENLENKGEFSEQVFQKDDPVKRTRKQRMGNICRRFWWLFLFALVVVVLVIVLPIIFVGYPRTARSAVNDSTLNVTSMSLLNPEPNSFDLSLVSVLGTKSSFKPTIDAFNASVYLEGSSTPFMNFEIPAVKAQNGAVTTIQGQHITIADINAFTEYTGTVLANQTVTLIIQGQTQLKEGSLQKTSIDYNKTITMAGLSGLANFSIEGLKVNLATEADGTNLYANVSIPNHTVQTIALGDVALSMSIPVANGTQNFTLPVGTTTLYNATLYPGNNSIPFRAKTNQTLILDLVQKYPTFLKALPIEIKTLNCSVNGVNIPYLTNALAGTTLFTLLDVSSAL